MAAFDPAPLLQAERAHVEALLEDLYGGFVPSDGLGFGKRVGDGTAIAVERITDVGKQELLLDKLLFIERAEEALKANTYGSCEVCGEIIPQARLEARPWSVRCVQHA